jgi:hypothetical protein
MTRTDYYLVKRLRALLADHEAAIRTLTATLKLLEPSANHAPRQAPNSSAAANPVLSAAITLDHARRNGVTRRNRQPGYHTKTAIEARRKQTAAFLATFDTRKPTPGKLPREYSSLANKLGYLTRKGDGYVRTAKPFIIDIAAVTAQRSAKHVTPAEKPAAPPRPRSKKHERRAATANTLRAYSRTTPKPLARGLVIMVTHGYLKKSGDGYIRTDKPFTV